MEMQTPVNPPVHVKLSWLVWAFSLAGLAAVLLLGNQPLLTGKAVANWDADQDICNYYILMGDYARAGKLVTWDPWSEAGTPIHIVPDYGFTSPLKVACAAITGPTLKGYFFYWLLSWFLGGLGMLLLARQLQVPWWGGWVVAVLF